MDIAAPSEDIMIDLRSSLHKELSLIWAGHKAVGLEGYMSVYTNNTQDPMAQRARRHRILV
jgi:hypothetical protein